MRQLQPFDEYVEGLTYFPPKTCAVEGQGLKEQIEDFALGQETRRNLLPTGNATPELLTARIRGKICCVEYPLLKTVGQIAGIGGIALGIFFLLFRDVIRKTIFPRLARKQAFQVILVFMVLVWLIALAGIAAWVYVGNGDARSQDARTSLDVNDQARIERLMLLDAELSRRLRTLSGSLAHDTDALLAGVKQFIKPGQGDRFLSDILTEMYQLVPEAERKVLKPLCELAIDLDRQVSEIEILRKETPNYPMKAALRACSLQFNLRTFNIERWHYPFSQDGKPLQTSFEMPSTAIGAQAVENDGLAEIKAILSRIFPQYLTWALWNSGKTNPLPEVYCVYTNHELWQIKIADDDEPNVLLFRLRDRLSRERQRIAIAALVAVVNQSGPEGQMQAVQVILERPGGKSCSVVIPLLTRSQSEIERDRARLTTTTRGSDGFLQKSSYPPDLRVAREMTNAEVNGSLFDTTSPLITLAPVK